MLLAIDPGQNSPGLAVFDDADRLIAVTNADTSDVIAKSDGDRWLRVARVLLAWSLRAMGKPSEQSPVTVVFEKPQWYRRKTGGSKGDPNQLVGIAGVAANLTGMLSTYYYIDVASPTPAEWIGQLPKVCPVCKGRKTAKRTDGKKGRGSKIVICAACDSSAWGTPRGRRIRSRLTPAELALVPDQNDAIDAVGIGLWALGRLERVSVFSNGRDGR